MIVSESLLRGAVSPCPMCASVRLGSSSGGAGYVFFLFQYPAMMSVKVSSQQTKAVAAMPSTPLLTLVGDASL